MKMHLVYDFTSHTPLLFEGLGSTGLGIWGPRFLVWLCFGIKLDVLAVSSLIFCIYKME